MMFYRNTLNKVKKVKYQKIKLNFNSNFDCDNEYLNVDFPQYCINFDASNNQLSNSYGDSDGKTNSKINRRQGGRDRR